MELLLDNWVIIAHKCDYAYPCVTVMIFKTQV